MSLALSRKSESKATARMARSGERLGYSSAFGVVVGAFLAGVCLHYLAGPVPATWETFWLLSTPVVGLAVYTRWRRLDLFSQWLSGIPLAVASTVGILLLILVGGLVPTSALEPAIGAPTVWATWPFTTVGLLVAINLACSTAKRIWPMTYRNFLFTISHFGLLTALAGGSIGAIMVERRNMILFQGMPSAIAYDEHGNEYATPFLATLKKFDMDYFEPTLALIELDPKSDDLSVTPGSQFVAEGMRERIGEFHVEVVRYMPKAAWVDERWVEVPWPTAAPVARIAVFRGQEALGEGWVSCGSLESPVRMHAFAEGYAIAMPLRKPRRFHSIVEIEDEAGVREIDIEVNKAATVGRYRLYQVSYDERFGPASPYSVIELIQDRGIPVVYAGLGLVLLGALMGLGQGVMDKKGGQK